MAEEVKTTPPVAEGAAAAEATPAAGGENAPNLVKDEETGEMVSKK